jgi:hypothetical protein
LKLDFLGQIWGSVTFLLESIKNDHSDPGKYKVIGVYESRVYENATGVYTTPVASEPLEIEIVN